MIKVEHWKDFLHKLSRKLINAYDYIFVEDLHMKGISQSLRLGKSTMDNGWGMFCEFLTYKSKFAGKSFSKIDKWFPSTKTCSNCGHAKEKNATQGLLRLQLN